uniref:Uncharacterized protein n=1 Tax=Helianthus annuus TaxID=4232 RepID=A0A251SKY9_HELAN
MVLELEGPPCGAFNLLISSLFIISIFAKRVNSVKLRGLEMKRKHAGMFRIE